MTRILTVDDEPDLVWLIKRILEKRNESFEVIEAFSGREGLERARKEKPDVIILDVMMPDLSGWEVARELKEDEETKHIPIIILSVITEKEGIKKSFEYAKADYHVGKPFEIDVLLKIIEIAAIAKNKEEITKEIEKAIARNKKMKEVLNMINPKIYNYKYEFLEKAETSAKNIKDN